MLPLTRFQSRCLICLWLDDDVHVSAGDDDDDDDDDGDDDDNDDLKD